MAAKTSRSAERNSFARIQEIMEIPYLLETQKQSYAEFLQADLTPDQRRDQGLQEAFKSIFPVRPANNPSSLEFVEYNLGHPKYSVRECIERGMTFAAPLKVKLQLIVRATPPGDTQPQIQDIKEQETYLGEIPLMTDNGTFIVNGAERVIVSQLHRSPGVSFSATTLPNGKSVFSARIIPHRGAWVELELDANNLLWVMIDRRRKFLAPSFLRLFGLNSDADFISRFFKTTTLDLSSLSSTSSSSTPVTPDDSLIGQQLLADVRNPKTQKLLASKGQRLTKSLLANLAKLQLPIPVPPPAYHSHPALGNILSNDLVNTSTGEILAESFDPVTPTLLLHASTAGFDSLPILDPTVHPSNDPLLLSLQKDKNKSLDEALLDFFRKIRPGNPVSLNAANRLLNEMFFTPHRYDLGSVGRHKLSSRFPRDKASNSHLLDAQDICDVISYLLRLQRESLEPDDIDHLGNRRVRSVGELLQNQIRLGLAELEKTARERMAIIDLENMLPHNLINSKPVVSAIKDFFGRSQLSQFMDQTNPLAELTHKRRLSALGPGGLSRDRAGFEVRDIHHTHYGRVCPIETPEGPNIGLISSLCTFARINALGFIETPYRKVKGGKVLEEIEYMTADVEDQYIIAQANAPLDPKTGRFLAKEVLSRSRGDFLKVPAEEITHMDISPKQLVSVSAALIPFLEHDDANRALMGSNMQRQGVPLLYTESPVVGTGIERKVAMDSGACVIARNEGSVVRATANEIVVKTLHETSDTYALRKFERSNQNTCINQKPIVEEGQKVKRGQVLADGPAIDHGELALGKNLLVAFMPWGGYNFEDAILLSDRLVKDDTYTSIHIEQFELDARDTKLGKEEITRDIPNVSEEALAKLDQDGLVFIGAHVKPGDILVGKVTPKGETELTSEEKLLRAIFGEKAGDVRDASLKVPPGTEGTVIAIHQFARRDRSTANTRREKQQLAEIQKQHELDLANLGSTFDAELTAALKKIDGEVRHPETGAILLKAGATLKSGAVQAVQQLLKSGLNPVSGPIGAKVKNLWTTAIRQQAELEERSRTLAERVKAGDELPPGVIKLVKVYLAVKRKVAVGDKMAGRHGNKGVIAKIMAEEDMPYLADGTPVDMVLNPLGVPSRMNVGQIFETHLGWAAYKLDRKVATPVFDGADEHRIKSWLDESSLGSAGQVTLYDGLSGEPFDRPVTVGVMYMLKLAHLVDEKMHARSIGPYSLVTQQPLGGKAQFGGQRFGEMEVWALEAYGAAHTLQEMLTLKSDDVSGRTRTYESIVKNLNPPIPGLPESFNVLVKELQGLGLNLELLSARSAPGAETEETESETDLSPEPHETDALDADSDLHALADTADDDDGSL